eukprot:13701068-Ditylum_brightwellii.AAC.1
MQNDGPMGHIDKQSNPEHDVSSTGKERAADMAVDVRDERGFPRSVRQKTLDELAEVEESREDRNFDDLAEKFVKK